MEKDGRGICEEAITLHLRSCFRCKAHQETIRKNKEAQDEKEDYFDRFDFLDG